MDAIHADFSISMSEFKKNPAQVLRTAGEKPVAVLNHNRPAFYMVTPKLFGSVDRRIGRSGSGGPGEATPGTQKHGH